MSKKQKMTVILTTILGVFLTLPLFANAASSRWVSVNAGLVSTQLNASPSQITLPTLDAGDETSFTVSVAANPNLAARGDTVYFSFRAQPPYKNRGMNDLSPYIDYGAVSGGYVGSITGTQTVNLDSAVSVHPNLSPYQDGGHRAIMKPTPWFKSAAGTTTVESLVEGLPAPNGYSLTPAGLAEYAAVVEASPWAEAKGIVITLPDDCFQTTCCAGAGDIFLGAVCYVDCLFNYETENAVGPYYSYF